MCLPVREVLILLGSTIVSPKEIYHVVLPATSNCSDSLSYRVCMTTMFKHLVKTDLIGKATAVKTPKKISVLLLAERDPAFSDLGLIPKVQYKIPQRGQHFIINFHSQKDELTPMANRSGELDISGIELLDISVELEHPTPSSKRVLSDNISDVTDLMVDVNLGGDANQMIWYQIPHTVIGYRGSYT